MRERECVCVCVCEREIECVCVFDLICLLDDGGWFLPLSPLLPASSQWFFLSCSAPVIQSAV